MPKGKQGFQKGHPQFNTGRTRFKRGHIPWCIGKHHTEKTKKKIGQAKKGQWQSKQTRRKRSGSLHKWHISVGHLPSLYSVDWTEDLRRAVRKRDKYTCQLCGIEPAIHCHHIDYDKQNCNPDNLVTLCKGCHIKTNANRRYWQNLFSGNRG